MTEKKERVGEFYILAAGLLWGLFPVITILTYNTLSPLVVLGWSQILAGILFGVVLTVRGTWIDVVNTRALKDMFLATLFTGILFYLLFFFGLMHTSAGNAGIIALAEIFFSFLLFNVFRKEAFPLVHALGAVAMLGGALIVLSPNLSSFHKGDIFILFATMIAPFGNFFQRRARTLVSTESVLFVRSLVAGCVVLVIAYFIGAEPFNVPFSMSVLALLLINGIVLMGFTKVLWLEAIHRISVTKANALSSVSPVMTLLFAYLLLKESPTEVQLLAIIPMSAGIYLLSRNKQKTLKRA